ncbi:hypothetical protein ACHQM5_012276 [Ranunculus cassubicifolius]
MTSVTEQLHVFFLPFMAHGHTIPIIDISRLFASQGIKCTIITTPLNVPSFTEALSRDKKLGLDISIQILEFPSVPGLPKGCEDIDSVPSPAMMQYFFKALALLEQPVEDLLTELRPHCLVSDMFFPWSAELANRHGIPRLVFYGMACFPHCAIENIKRYTPFKNVDSNTEPFVVPGLPHRVEMTRSELADHILTEGAGFGSGIIGEVERAEPKSFGVIVNSFYDLEPDYNEYFIKEMGRRVWSIGPVSLYNADKATRGKKSALDEKFWSSWLDSRKPDSVLYVCFGSSSQFGTDQLLEIAMGLEASQVPFIWVVKMSDNVDKNRFPPKGFQEKINGKSLIITDWAPQVLILEHQAIGGFMTHCGWNSILEGVTAGLPFITWPVFADQFYNEKLITQVLQIGVSAGNGIWNEWRTPESVSVNKEMVEKAVNKVMQNSVDADAMRSKAKKLGVKAKKSVEEGGTSFKNWHSLIEELKVQSQKSESRRLVCN